MTQRLSTPRFSRPSISTPNISKNAAFIVTKTLLFVVALSISPLLAKDRPNIVIVLADDMGFSDLGCYGSEIETPHLDGLASQGLRFSHFYNTGRCCPTRAALLTGLHQHEAGIGHMTGNNGRPAYQGYLNRHCATIAELLRPAGYATLMTGKWHVGGAQGQWPLDRGFDRYFGCPTGGGFYFEGTAKRKKRPMVLDDQVVDFPPHGYVTDLFTDNALRFIDESVESSKPFFLYLAHIAPHWPLQAKPEDIAKYQGRYSNGWESIRRDRFAKQKALGLLPPSTSLSPAPKQVKRWQELPETKRNDLAYRMSVYAAQIDCIDQNIGKLIERLKKHGQFENTLFVFLSDNGCSAEGGPGGFRRGEPNAPIGTDASYASAGLEWANVSDTPFRKFKRYTYEGGIATPLIVHWPEGIAPSGEVCSQVGHVTDLMPTCLDVADVTYPEEREGHKLRSLAGQSLKPTFAGKALAKRHLFWSHEGNRAVRYGKWKAVSDNKQRWELYDLEEDRAEQHELSNKHPEILKQLASRYRDWADRVGVEPWPLAKLKQPRASRPNVVMIMADDVGVEGFGCYGSEQYQTPNLDRLARQGMRFTACHAQPLCTPTRVKLMTGRSNIFNYSAFSILPKAAVGPEQPSLGRRFQEMGYRTLVTGKWQLLGAEHYASRFRGKGSWPFDVGFDRCCLWQVDQLGPRYWQPLLNIDGVNTRFEKDEYGPDICTQHVLDMIKEESDRPFFIYYPMILVHDPFKATPKTTLPRGEQTKQSNFADMVHYMDHLVGRIAKQLDDSGKSRETLLVFTSDNGTHRTIQSSYRGRELNGGKGQTTDAGTHVPLIVRWPGTVPPETTCDDLIDFADFYPTLMKVAGASSIVSSESTSESDATRGISFYPQLQGRKGKPREWSFCYYNPRPERTKPIRFVRTKTHKLYADGRFYDVLSDPSESHPLPTDQLSNAQQATQKKLRKALASYPERGQSLLSF